MPTADPAAMDEPPLVPSADGWRRSFGSADTSGRFQFGPYNVRWVRDRGRSERQARSEFVVDSDEGGECCCWLSAAQPYSPDLRRGIRGGLDDRELVVVRNGPRPLRRLRRVDVRGQGIDWTIGGSWIGAQIREANGRVLWTGEGGGRVRVGLASFEAALVVALVVTEIPSTTSLLNVLRGI